MRIFKLFLLAFCLYCTSYFCHRQTEGFAVAKISSFLLKEKKETAPPLTLLEQNFYYLAKGGQSYVFLSEDGKSVLKLFRSSKLNLLLLIQKLLPFFKDSIAKEESHLKKTLESYQIAQDYLKEETGLLYTHLSSDATLLPALKIIDKLGIKHLLPASSFPFVIQQKAFTVQEMITNLMEQNQLSLARQALYDLLELISQRIAKGIADKDPNLAKNFGYLELKPIQIDGGSFTDLPTSSSKLYSSQESFQHWLNQHYPELSQDFQEEFNALFGQAQ